MHNVIIGRYIGKSRAFFSLSLNYYPLSLEIYQVFLLRKKTVH